MTSIPAPSSAPGVKVSPEALSKARVITLLSLTLLLALVVYYLVGVDEGMTSVFGKTMVIHAWVHDARPVLSFPAIDQGHRWRSASSGAEPSLVSSPACWASSLPASWLSSLINKAIDYEVWP
jgi:hypothetical protein